MKYFISQSYHKLGKKCFEQYSIYILRREILEINLFPRWISNIDLEEKVCEVLFLTGTKVKLDDLDACHRMKMNDNVINKFKNRKQRINMIFKQKEFKSKGDDLPALQFGRLLFINGSMRFANHVLFYNCRHLKNLGKILLH